MSKTRFTPGPWLLKSYTEIDHVTDKDGELLLGIHRYGGTVKDSTLIAAAPEMYRDLREAAHERCHDCPSRAEGDELACVLADGECFVQQWRKTLRKAGGE